jgi:[ribosomal protein S5]-alanine N-acetyltransferase
VIHRLGTVVLRKPEPRDAEVLYEQKNDPEVANLLGGFSLGYSRADIADWIENHRRRSDEIVWAIAIAADDRCIGHVGLYNIDHRVQSAEFAIMIGDREQTGRGLGKLITKHVLQYGFAMLNLNRIHLSFLASNARAQRLYELLGFRQEGVLRQAQFKAGNYVDVVLMALLRAEYADGGK